MGGGMDLQFPHHESEIAQSTIAHGHAPVKYWMHNNMITINGKKMGKSYNNVIKLTELFSGHHPMLEQAYHPMVIRFYILQTHYRSTLDFSNEALQAAGRALHRMTEAHGILKKLARPIGKGTDEALNQQVRTLCEGCEADMCDDFNTAKVLAGLFELVPIINGINEGHIAADALSAETFDLLQETFKVYLEEVLGVKPINEAGDMDLIESMMQVLIDIRQEARDKKNYALSDAIRDKLLAVGIQLKDGKEGKVRFQIKKD